jgi:hypothetical protein
VVQSYAALQAVEAQLAAFQRTVQGQREGMRLQRLRSSAGELSELDLRQLEAELAANEGQLLRLQRARGETARALAQLLGRSPRAVWDAAITPAAQPLAVAEGVPAGLPSSLLQQRPDVAAAEARLRAAGARVDVARAAYLPGVALSASLGKASRELGDLLDARSTVWSIVASLTQPIWNAGRLDATRDTVLAQQRQAELDYRDAVANAFREVRDALDAAAETSGSLALAQQRARALAEAARLTQLVARHPHQLFARVMPARTRRSPSSRISVMPPAIAAARMSASEAGVVDLRADRVIGHQQFVDAGAALVAGVAAFARSPHRGSGAQLAHQPLGQHAQQRGTEQERLHAHVGQARDGAGGVVGVQRGQHQVAGQRGLDGDLRGFEIADLADHDHVRVLAQDGAQRLGKTEVDLGIDLRLADAGQLVLDRVFHRHDVAAVLASSRLSAAYSVVVLPEPVGPVTRMMPCGWAISCSKRCSVSPCMPTASRLSLLSLLSSRRSTARSPWALGSVLTRTSTARVPMRRLMRPSCGRRFSADVELGHDLQARDQRRVQRAVGLHHFAQRAVDPEAHAGVALVGLDVDVAGAVARGLRQQALSMRMMGASSAGFQQVFDRGQLLHHARQVGVVRPR